MARLLTHARRAQHRRRRFRQPTIAAIAIVLIGAVTGISMSAHSSNRASTQAATPSAAPATSTIPPASTPPPTTTPTSSTTNPSTAPPNLLEATVSNYVASRTGTISLAVYDLNSNHLWQLGPSTPQDEASVVKVDILEGLLAQSQGQGLTTANQSVAQNMIENSDNDAATTLWNSAGAASGIAAFNSSAGLMDTTPSPCVVCAGFPWPGWGLTTTTPADQVALLKLLATPNAVLTDAERSYALGLMENVTPSERWGVSSGVPAQATVALKNGWLPLNSSDTNWQINSIGWISGVNRNYVIAVLTTGNPSEQYGIDTIDAISAIVYGDLA